MVDVDKRILVTYDALRQMQYTGKALKAVVTGPPCLFRCGDQLTGKKQGFVLWRYESICAVTLCAVAPCGVKLLDWIIRKLLIYFETKYGPANLSPPLRISTDEVSCSCRPCGQCLRLRACQTYGCPHHLPPNGRRC